LQGAAAPAPYLQQAQTLARKKELRQLWPFSIED